MARRRELISSQEIKNLPVDDREAFIEFEAICRARLEELVEDKGMDVEIEYMTRVIAAASAFGVDDVARHAISDEIDYTDFRRFRQTVMRVVTTLQIEAIRRPNITSLSLEDSDKKKIEHHLSQFRSRIVGASGLDQKLKERLLRKIDELQGLLNGGKFEFGKVLRVMATIATLVSQTESAIIKAPDALAAVMKVIGEIEGFQQGNDPDLLRHTPQLQIENKAEAEDSDDGASDPKLKKE